MMVTHRFNLYITSTKAVTNWPKTAIRPSDINSVMPFVFLLIHVGLKIVIH